MVPEAGALVRFLSTRPDRARSQRRVVNRSSAHASGRAMTSAAPAGGRDQTDRYWVFGRSAAPGTSPRGERATSSEFSGPRPLCSRPERLTARDRTVASIAIGLATRPTPVLRNRPDTGRTGQRDRAAVAGVQRWLDRAGQGTPTTGSECSRATASKPALSRSHGRRGVGGRAPLACGMEESDAGRGGLLQGEQSSHQRAA